MIPVPTISIHENIVLNTIDKNTVELEINSADQIEVQSNTYADIKIPGLYPVFYYTYYLQTDN